MFLPLVILEFVQAIKCFVSLAVTVVDKAGMLGGVMHFFMAAEDIGTGEGCCTAWLVARKAVGIDVGTGSSCSIAGGENREFSEVCDSSLGVSACGVVQLRSSSRD